MAEAVAMSASIAPLFAPAPMPDFAWAARLDALAARLVPWLALAAALLAAAALAVGLLGGPGGIQPGDAHRIVFVHVPAVGISLLIYLAMAVCAAFALARNAGLPVVLMTALAPTGAMFTLIALGTGALWSKPTWGQWWVWNARLTSELILMLVYVGFLSMRNTVSPDRRPDRAGPVLVLIGVVNLPIIYSSVRWWNGLHQGGLISPVSSPDMAHTMLAGMLLMVLAFGTYAAAAALARVRCLLRERDRARDPIFQELKR